METSGMIWLMWLLDKAGKDELRALDMLAGMTVAYAGQLFQVAYTPAKARARYEEIADGAEALIRAHEGDWGPMEWILAASALLAAAHEQFDQSKAAAAERVSAAASASEVTLQ